MDGDNFNKNTKKVISSSIGCQTRTVKSAMNVEKSSTLSGADTTVVFVARYSATGVATWKFLENSWGTQDFCEFASFVTRWSSDTPRHQLT